MMLGWNAIKKASSWFFGCQWAVKAVTRPTGCMCDLLVKKNDILVVSFHLPSIKSSLLNYNVLSIVVLA